MVLTCNGNKAENNQSEHINCQHFKNQICHRKWCQILSQFFCYIFLCGEQESCKVKTGLLTSCEASAPHLHPYNTY